jgi:riboflavin-specific deaminase-like protein
LINMAMTADGKIASVNRAVSSFGSRRDHEHLLELRATADAVMCGARTVELSVVTLGPGPARFRRLRRRRGLNEFNLRVIVSGSATINPRARIFQHRFSPILVLTTAGAGKRRIDRLATVADEVHVCGEKEIDFHEALSWLRRKWKVERLLCEGGGELNAALFRDGLVDELHLTLCPKVFAGRQAPTIADGLGVEHLVDAAQLELKSMRRVGDELFLLYRAVR